MKNEMSRRKFLSATGLTVGGMAAGHSGIGMPAYIKNLRKPNSLVNGVQLGVITYSFRSMPGSAEEILQYCIDSNVSAVELMGTPAELFAGAPEAPLRPPRGNDSQRGRQSAFSNPEFQEAMAAYRKEMAEWRKTVSMEKFEQLRKMYNDAGVSIYAYKPGALGVNNTDDEIHYAMKAAKTLGASHVTVEYPTQLNHIIRLGEIGAKNGIYVGYHGHQQQTFDMWDFAFVQSAYNASNIDIGHYVAAGYNPINYLRKRHSHIVSMHLKDRTYPIDGKSDNLPWGEGDTPIGEVLRMVRDEQYPIYCTVELEYKIPEGSDAVQEVARCIEFARKELER